MYAKFLFSHQLISQRNQGYEGPPGVQLLLKGGGGGGGGGGGLYQNYKGNL